jgi:hypothetical protein
MLPHNFYYLLLDQGHKIRLVRGRNREEPDVLDALYSVIKRVKSMAPSGVPRKG